MTYLARITRYLTLFVKIGAIGILLIIPMTAATVGYTSRSKFCSSCHIMEPYYESWKHSVHNFVQCVDCHYEPGLLETVQGKFKALSQLAKYATATEGTKPWAEVSDNSCMRDGCHSQRLLEGPLQFGRVSFDHRHHLLETRRGRRLRCTSCHSQIVQGSHITVTEASCFLCHFRLSEKTPAHGDCLTCHGPPEEAVQVAGIEFLHSEYTARGVDCLDCHRNVTRGTGAARKSRCRSCHAAVAHIERFNDTAFIHENHITLHSVECSECHEAIDHSLPPRTHQQSEGDCGQCHPALHQTQWQFFAGRAVDGLPEDPSPMFLTRVDCGACHKNYGSWAKDGSGHDPLAGPEVAEATAVSCMRCHGPEFEEMLAEWRTVVDRSLTELEEQSAALGELPTADRPEEVDSLLERARTELAIVKRDGSHGAHNISYALDILDDARESLAQAAAQAGAAETEPADLPAMTRSELDCARTCHVGVADAAPTFGDVSFTHRPHLTEAELDCDACHEPVPRGQPGHGVTTISPADCTDCHHEAEQPSCARCHAAQEHLLRGDLTIDDLEIDLENPMGELGCTDCHTSFDEEVRPTVEQACVDCHDDDYREMVAEWLADGNEELQDAREKLARVELLSRQQQLAGDRPGEVGGLLDEARRCIDAVARGRSVHNVIGSSSLLETATELLDRCQELLEAPR